MDDSTLNNRLADEVAADPVPPATPNNEGWDRKIPGRGPAPRCPIHRRSGDAPRTPHRQQHRSGNGGKPSAGAALGLQTDI